MKPVNMQGSDDCLRACIATLLDLEYKDSFVVDRSKGAPWWFDQLKDWGNYRDYTVKMTKATHLRRWNYGIAIGPSPRGDWTHAVVVDNTLAIIHDPKVNGEPLTSFYSVIVFIPHGASIQGDEIDGRQVYMDANGIGNYGSLTISSVDEIKLRYKLGSDSIGVVDGKEVAANTE